MPSVLEYVPSFDTQLCLQFACAPCGHLLRSRSHQDSLVKSRHDIAKQ